MKQTQVIDDYRYIIFKKISRIQQLDKVLLKKYESKKKFEIIKYVFQ